MARGASLGVWLDLQNNPLGTGKGENFNVPANYAIPPARIYVINHSRTKAWKRLVLPVSRLRGAEDALIYDKELAKIYNVDTLYKTVEGGRDMSRYKTEVHPVIYSFQIGQPMMGAKPKVYGIPPARDAQTPPPKVEVLEGAWDLFLGNYARMRGFDKFLNMGVKEPDMTVQGDEKTRLARYWSRRLNPVLRYTDDGVTTETGNEHGFLEFVRETVTATAETIDKEYLSALDLVEA
jgi:hypothetical protein